MNKKLMTILLALPMAVNANIYEYHDNAAIDMHVNNDFNLERIKSDYEKNHDEFLAIQQINYYFNQYPYRYDSDDKEVNDYWKTPEEFLSDNGGDCEDYSVIKYFELQSMGISKDKLNFYYVYLKPENAFHMMLGYKETPNSEVHFLDNVSSKVVKESLRTDVVVLSIFNDQKLKIKAKNTDLISSITANTVRYSNKIKEMQDNIK